MKHYYETIQGWFNFQDAYRDAVKAANDHSVLVELGCWKGRSGSFLLVELLNADKTPKVYFIDHWGGSNEPDHKADPELDKVFDLFFANVSKSKYPNATIMRMDTKTAADLFDDNSVDFVWVDAGHEYQEVMDDLMAWWPKLKRGGVIGGDDLMMDGVKRAVSQFFPKYETGENKGGWQWWRVKKDR